MKMRNRVAMATVTGLLAAAGLTTVWHRANVAQPIVPDVHPLPISRGALLGAHICRSCEFQPVTFRWTFADERFEIAPDRSEIPREILDGVLRPGATAGRIEGKWQIVDEDLLLTEIRTEGKQEWPDVRLHPFDTAVVRLNLGDKQFVIAE